MLKKLTLLVSIAFAIVSVAVATFNVIMSSEKSSLIDMKLANIEVLAQGEDPVAVCEVLGQFDCSNTDSYITGTTYYSNPAKYKAEGYEQDWYCGNCDIYFVKDAGNGCCPPE